MEGGPLPSLQNATETLPETFGAFKAQPDSPLAVDDRAWEVSFFFAAPSCTHELFTCRRSGHSSNLCTYFKPSPGVFIKAKALSNPTNTHGPNSAEDRAPIIGPRRGVAFFGVRSSEPSLENQQRGLVIANHRVLDCWSLAVARRTAGTFGSRSAPQLQAAGFRTSL